MVETPAPAAAVRIVLDALAVRGYVVAIDRAEAPRVVAALARAGWLHDPAAVAALRTVAEAAAEVDEILHQEDQIWSNAEAAETLGQRLLDARALGALAAVDDV